MWIYEKRLEYPVRITKPDPRMAKLLMAQYGGPDSDLGANKGIAAEAGQSRRNEYRRLNKPSIIQS
jgi:Mn-containing catalase